MPKFKDLRNLRFENLVVIGNYHNLEDAIKARKQAEEKYFGEWSYDNSMI